MNSRNLFLAPLFHPGRLLGLLALLAASASTGLRGELLLDGSGNAVWQPGGQAILTTENLAATWILYENPDETSFTEEDFTASREILPGGFRIVYPWGSVGLTWESTPGILTGTLTLENTADLPIADFDIELFRLVQPAEPVVTEGFEKDTRYNLDHTAAYSWVTGEDRLTFGLLSEKTPVRVILETANAEKTEWRIRIRGGVHRMDDGGVTFPLFGNARAEPGGTLTLPFLLKTNPASVNALDAMAVFRSRLHDETAVDLNWPDRRPIAQLFTANNGSISDSNPVGLFWDRNLDTSDPDAVMEKAMAYADRAIEAMSAVDAQGAILWDIEANNLPISYVGDPRMLPLLNPAMDGVADALFARFRDAGFTVGVTIRPTQVYFNEEGDNNQWEHGTGSHGPDRNPLNESYDDIWPEGLPWWRFFPTVERMDRKIQYAKDRWGCRIFYIDTNGAVRMNRELGKVDWFLLSADIYRRLMERHPDILIIPELQQGTHGRPHLAYWGTSAPYGELDLGSTGTPGFVRNTYPEAFSIVNITDGNIEANREALIESVRTGDILLFRGWFNDAKNVFVNEIYEAARNP